MKTASPIVHDRQTGQIRNANPFEWLGIQFMSLGGLLTTPISHVGYSWITRAIKLVLPSQRVVSSKLNSDTIFAYPYGDLYWSRLAHLGSTYAPDVENFLHGVRHVDYAFIDCGANFGYFSALVTSQTYGNKPAIAIEADPDTYQHLIENAALNNHRFDIRHNAIFSKSGETVNIYGDKHEARSIVSDEPGEIPHGNVETLAPDDLASWVTSKNLSASILKLDVEGVEIDAMKGATKLLETDCVLFYEDHASDKNHEITRFAMDELGLTIFRPDDNGKCHLITDIKQMNDIKTNPRVGYDFLATKSSFWLKEIEKLC